MLSKLGSYKITSTNRVQPRRFKIVIYLNVETSATSEDIRVYK